MINTRLGSLLMKLYLVVVIVFFGTREGDVVLDAWVVLNGHHEMAN